ncbi:hypothetical protein RCL_jg23772.t1 [Rhizophagus clarus]|uniref:Uncharacterized protein n=1 Tax=Rhizophagus clarus TaxID=94130 RepID=A0A8H3QRZ2_9GLOM|nr:hypothetical protein RCL_jg23772.t1 [Rhizophagus clarus]
MRFRNRVITTLPFGWVSHWSPSADELEFLRNAYYHAQNQDGFFIIKQPYSGRLLSYMTSVVGEKFQPPLKYECTSDFDEFIKCNIERTKPSALRDSFSRKNKQSAIIINPNVGSGLKQMGFGLLCEWFFTLEDELLREGMNMQVHFNSN